MSMACRYAPRRHEPIPRDINCCDHDDCSFPESLAEDNSIDSLSTRERALASNRMEILRHPPPPRCADESKSSPCSSESEASIGPTKAYLQLTFPSSPSPQVDEIWHYQDTQDDETPRPRFFCRLPRWRKVSIHSRLEMWQHQLGKPFRALPRIRLNSRSNLDCFGGKILDAVIGSPDTDGLLKQESSVSCCSDEDAAGFYCEAWWTDSQKIAVEWNGSEAGAIGQTNNNAIDGSEKQSGTTSSQVKVSHGDVRWLYSRSVWPEESEPYPMEEPHTEEAIILTRRACSNDSTVWKQPNPVTVFWDALTLTTTQETHESSDDEESSDEESVLICHTDLD